MSKKIIFLLLFLFLIPSCADTWDSVKKGLTGAKQKSTEEFFVEKKDPLVLPTDFDSLPLPEDRIEAKEQVLSIEKAFEESSSAENVSSGSSSIEESIIKKIKRK